MEYRINTRVVTVVAVLIIIAIGLFAYTFVSAPTPEDVPVATSEPTEQVPDRIITAKHQYVDGIHTIAGMVTVPTPCHRVLADPYLLPDGVTVEVRFSTLLEGEACPAQPTDVPFRVTFEAPENATITVLWDGAPVRLSLVPVAQGESLDDVLYIKG